MKPEFIKFKGTGPRKQIDNGLEKLVIIAEKQLQTIDKERMVGLSKNNNKQVQVVRQQRKAVGRQDKAKKNKMFVTQDLKVLKTCLIADSICFYYLILALKINKNKHFLYI